MISVAPITVSLIIIAYESADLLPACIESALETTPPSCEIIVVDNASQDTTRSLVQEYGGRVRFVPLARNIGFGRAANVGAAAARGDIFIFLNPDTTFPPGWLEPLVQTARHHTDIALCCPQTTAPGGIPAEPVEAVLRDKAALPGCGLTARRDIWLKLGGFDEAIFLYWEDTELCWRAWLQGWRVVTVNAAWIWHARSATTKRFGRWDGQRMQNSLYTHLKLRPWQTALPFIARQIVVTLVKSAMRPTLAAALFQAWGWNLAHLAQTMHKRRQVRTGLPKERDMLLDRLTSMTR